MMKQLGPTRLARWLRSLFAALVLIGFSSSASYLIVEEPAAHAKKKPKKKKKGEATAAKGKKGKKGKQAASEAPNIEKKDLKKEKELKPKEDLGGVEQTEAAQTVKQKVVPKEISEQKAASLTPEQLLQRKQRAAAGAKLDEEIGDCEQLMQFTDPEDPTMATVLQRCADLYWEKNKELFFCSEDFNTPKDKRDYCKKEMKAYQQRTLDIYDRIIKDYANAPGFDDILYSLGLYKVELERHTQATKHFKDLIRFYPNSERVPEAWFQLGEYFFNVENSADKALSAYKYAAANKDAFIYPFSIYKQGWCYINKGDWDLALRQFKNTVFLTCGASKDMKTAWSGLCKDSRNDYVRAYSNVGDVNLALEDFKKIGGPENYRRMMENLGLQYVDQGKHEQAIVAFRVLIQDNTEDIRTPIFQAYIVDAAASLGNKGNTVTQVGTLASYYEKARKLAGDLKAKGGDPKQLETIEKSLKEATEIAENTVRKIAIDYDKEGSKQKKRDVLSLARDCYKYYLGLFPESTHVFEMSYLYAELLYKLADMTDNEKQFAQLMSEAADQYIAVVKMNPNPDKPKQKAMVEASAGNSVRALSEVVDYQEKQKPIKIEGNVKVDLPPIYAKLIEACQTYIHYRPSGEDIVEIRYKMARIYYLFNHFEKAAPAFNDIVANHPENEVACYAANLTIDIYTGQEDFAQLKRIVREYLDNKKLSCGEKDRAVFADIEMKSTFKLAEKLEKDEKFLDAAEAYLAFHQQFRDSKFSVVAVNNAAVCFDKGNKIEKAIETRLYLANQLASHPHADKDLIRDTLYDIAQSYERIVDFSSAAHYLELFVERYPTDKRSKDAIFNAGLYRAVLHEVEQSERNRQLYVRVYAKGDVQEAARTIYSICETRDEEARLLEEAAIKDNKVKDLEKAILKRWVDAHDCYYDYLRNKTYEPTSLDRACWAQWRRAEIMRTKSKNIEGAQEIQDFLRKSWAKGWEDKVKREKATMCAAAIAELRFRDMTWGSRKYFELTLSEMNPGSQKRVKEFQASLKAKVKERDKLIEDFKKIVEIGVAEWSLAALYYIGELYKDSLDKLLQAPVPKRIQGYKLSEEDIELLREKLAEMGEPIKALAVEAYQIAANKASELGVYNKWSMKALDRLQEYGEYPLVVELELPPIPPALTLRQLSFITDLTKREPLPHGAVELRSRPASGPGPSAPATGPAGGAPASKPGAPGSGDPGAKPPTPPSGASTPATGAGQ